MFVVFGMLFPCNIWHTVFYLWKIVKDTLCDIAEDEDDQDEDDVEGLTMADTSRVEEIPPKEPLFNAVPLKSALKKRPAPSASPASTPLATPLQPRQDHHHASFKSVYNFKCPLYIQASNQLP